MGGSQDQALVARAQAGDRGAVDELLRNHYDRIHAICHRIADNDADAADATQEALIAIVRGLPKFDGRAAFSTWSYRVATNSCLDELRRRKRRPTPTDFGTTGDRSETFSDTEASTFDIRLTERAAMSSALSQLPQRFREPMLLRDCAGLDYAEIAEALDLAPGTVRSRIARGRAKLRNLIDSGNQPPPEDRQKKQL